MLVFTQRGISSPFSRAFRARRPAPTMTEGLEVLVQEVMAAMTTVPSEISTSTPSWLTVTVRPEAARTPPATVTGSLPPSPAQLSPGRSSSTGFASSAEGRSKPAGTSLGRSVSKRLRISAIRIRSCGCFGPARLGSTVERSSSSDEVNSGSGVSSVRNRLSSLLTRSTRSTTSGLRALPRRYSSVASSTGKKPMVAPYSGDMLASVALSGSERLERPAP